MTAFTISHKNQIVGVISSEAERFTNGDLTGFTKTQINISLALKIKSAISYIDSFKDVDYYFKKDTIDECLYACSYYGFSKNSIKYNLIN